jgi:hypothetical protein
MDTWGRTKISTKRGTNVYDRNSDKPGTSMSTVGEDKRNLSRAKERAKK